MEPEDMAVKLEAVDQRTYSYIHHIDDMEKDHQALDRLAAAEEVLTTNRR